MATTIDPSKPILVTGASGYVASRIVKDLLEQGMHVRGTVRNKSRKEKYDFLEAIAAGSQGTLEVFEADLLKEGSFDAAMEGCELVMHTASPFRTQVKDPQKELVDPALLGTRNVLHAVNASPAVKRVVLTSSVVAIFGDSQEIQEAEGGIFRETDWNTSSSLAHQPYPYSKTLAEKEAWKINAAQDRWDMVTIHPAFVMGPSLTNSSSSMSLEFMQDLLGGKMKMGAPAMHFGLVDVREVSTAHIQAGFTPGAKGRYVTCHKEGVSMLEMADALRAHYGDRYKLPKKQLPKFLVVLFGPLQGFSRKFIRANWGFRSRFDNQRTVDELGVEFRPWEQSLVDLAEQLIRDGKA